MQENRYEGLRGNEVQANKMIGKDIMERSRIAGWQKGGKVGIQRDLWHPVFPGTGPNTTPP